MADLGNARVALVHDWLNQAGGAEVVLRVLVDRYPGAPVYTTMFDPGRVPMAASWPVRTSWMDRLPAIHAHHQPYLPLYPLAWETTRLAGYDLVLSNKSGFCHGVRIVDPTRSPGRRLGVRSEEGTDAPAAGGGPATGPRGSSRRAVHVCYCLTPTRFVWQPDEYLAYERVPSLVRLALGALLPFLRRWDLAAARRVDHFLAISTVVQQRIRDTYGRESTVIFPPAELDHLVPAPAEALGDYYVALSRLIPYKRLDLAIEAFNRLGRPLVVIGDGRDRARLEALAGPTVRFTGRLPADEVARLVARSQGLIWPGIEDYGIAPIEAMAAGRPVIARRAGGVLDTVIEGRTGVFFDDESAVSLAAAVERAEAVSWDAGAIRRHALTFSRSAFERHLDAYLAEVMAAGA